MTDFMDGVPNRLAFSRQVGKEPTVMFLTGFKSDMSGSKAEALAVHCAANKQAFLRFDYSGHGQSGGAFMEGTIGQWKRDALAMLDAQAQGEVILVGSSMGAWLALLLALERPERIKALVGVASAPDFTERLIWEKLNDTQKEALQRDGVFYAPSCYGEEPYPITLTLIEEARQHLLLHKPIPIQCPVCLLHGTADEDVPVEMAHLLAQKIPQAQLTLIQGGTHRLSEKNDLNMLCAIIRKISNSCF